MKKRVLLPILSMVLAGLVLLNSGLSPSALQAQEPSDTEISEETRLLVHAVRGETVGYHDLDTAMEDGYGKFLDCFQHGPGLGMGQHYVNGDLLDDTLDPMHPEALVFEPREDDTLILVAFEYIVPAAAWDPDDEGREPPVLFDQEFNLKTNIPDTPPIWALHIWLWSHNPEGLFADYNPLIICPEDQPITEMMH